MNIRQNLALKFCLIVATLFILFAYSLYYFSNSYREVMFDIRMKNKGINAATMLIDINPIDSVLLRTINLKTKSAMIDASVFIFNSDNKVIYSNTNDTVNEKIKTILLQVGNNTNIKFNIDKKEAIGFDYLIKGKQFKIIVSAFDKYGMDNLLHLKIILISGILLSVIVSYFAGLLFSGYALQPISKIINDVDEITVSKLNTRLGEGNQKDEITRLAIAFNQMLERLEIAFESQKNFVSNASHELRTPLTSITGQIEVSLMNRNLSDETRATLSSILEDTRNLNKLSNGLLELVQTDSDIFDKKFSSVRIDEIIGQARADIIKHNKAYKIDIEFSNIPQDEEKLILHGNEQLLKTGILNIVENACKYSDNSTAKLVVSFKEKGIEIIISDKGIGIDEKDIQNIFNPFFRGTNAKPKHGQGIGLALAQKIIKIHTGEISITSKLNHGTSVRISLPYK